jgi:diguanylate cyclase (GGDEF)-like protein
MLADLIIPPRYRAAHAKGLRSCVAGRPAGLLDRRLELSALDRSGREFPVEVTITQDGTLTPVRFYAFLHDISERRLSESLLHAQLVITRVFAEARSTNEAMRGLLAGLGEAMEWQSGAWWSREEGGEILRCRSIWRRDPAVGLEFETASLELELARGVGLAGRAWASGEPVWTADIAYDERSQRAQLAAGAGLHRAVGVPVIADREIRYVIEFFSSQVGEPDRAMLELLRTLAGQIGGLLSLLDRRLALITKLQRLALTDDLTGLANRRAWHEHLERELARARRHGDPLCVAMLDLDHFKRFNDAHGHQAGDALLVELAQAWRTQLRVSDILARYGGEEFALLLVASPIAAAGTVVERVRTATPHGQTCSAGVAALHGSESAEQLVGRADAALYEAKATGRDRSVIAEGGT